jgi:hypothetical protein
MRLSIAQVGKDARSFCRSKGGSIAAEVVYAFCGAGMTAGDFSDLAVYCFLSFAFAGIMVIGGIVQKD